MLSYYIREYGLKNALIYFRQDNEEIREEIRVKTESLTKRLDSNNLKINEIEKELEKVESESIN